MKTCTKCGLEKDASEFYKKRGECVDCVKIYKKEYAQNNKEKIAARKKHYREQNKDKIRKRKKEYYEENKEKIREYKRKYNQKNKERLKERRKKYQQENKEVLSVKAKEYRERNKERSKRYLKQWYKQNAEKVKQYREDNKEYISKKCKEYREKNKKEINEKNYQYRKHRRKTDLNTKIRDVLRSRLQKALKNGQKTGSAVRDLGCTIPELKVYLESKFQPGMSWENWSKDGWHVDHIIPLSSFDLANREELLKACHYTNLQPLWATDNLQKSNKLISNT